MKNNHSLRRAPVYGGKIPLLAVPCGMEIGNAIGLRGRLAAIVEPHPLDEFKSLGRRLSPIHPTVHL